MGVKSSKHRKSELSEKNNVKGKNNNKKSYNKQEEPIMHEKVRESNGSGSLSINGSTKQTTTTYEREMMGFAFKKAEWKQERKKLKDEVKMLRALVDEKEHKIREMLREERENKHGINCIGGDDDFVGQKRWGFLGAQDLVLVDQMREERARRDETVEKWKQLYLAIKMELDDLIQRTHEGGLYWRAEEEDIAEEQKKNIQSKEETIKELKSKLGSMEQQMFKRDREVDILRQSLKIMSSKKVLPPKYPSRKVVATPNKVATNFNNNNKK